MRLTKGITRVSFKLSGIDLRVLTPPSLTQMYFCDSKVRLPNLNNAGSSPSEVSLKTSWKRKGRFCYMGYMVSF